jgi:hypothetical protein
MSQENVELGAHPPGRGHLSLRDPRAGGEQAGVDYLVDLATPRRAPSPTHRHPTSLGWGRKFAGSIQSPRCSGGVPGRPRVPGRSVLPLVGSSGSLFRFIRPALKTRLTTITSWG